MRIIAGSRRGRVLAAPAGPATRPTADRVRQALFDMLLHAPWGGHALLADAHVLDAFAGTGALGLEALSRGAAHATFFETDRMALAALRANIRTCRWEQECTVLARDVTRTPQAPRPASLLFLDPPYHKNLVPQTMTALHAAGWVAPGALAVVETARDEAHPYDPAEGAHPTLLAERQHGAARLSIWQL